MTDYTIRPAAVDDIPDLVALRRLMHEAMGYADHPRLDEATAATERAFRRRLADGSLRSWVAVAPDGTVVATGSLYEIEHLPSPTNLSGRIAVILNVSTRPDYRRQGLGRAIMTTMLDWCRARGIRTVSLQATPDGRPLYLSLGFRPTDELRLSLLEPD